MKGQEALPKYVSKTKRGFEYRPYLGWKDDKPDWGPRQVIAAPSASSAEVWEAWELQQTEMYTLAWLLDEYTKSKRFMRLATKTQADYITYKDSLLSTRIEGGVFGRVQLSHITKRTIRGFLDSYPHPVAANRRVAMLKSAWNWADELYELPTNPCLGVRMNEELPRQRYISDEEFDSIKALANPYLVQIMELAYLCRMRKSEVLGLRREHIVEDGLTVIRSKGSEGEITLWSDRLRAAVSDVNGGEYICYGYSTQGFKSAWRRLIERTRREGIEHFTLHDLKAKGISDQVNNWAGHRSPNMRKVYVRKLQLIEATA